MAIDRNKALVRRFVAATNHRDYEALADLLSPAFVRRCPATPDVEVRSSADFRRFLENEATTFPDARMTLETLVAEDDRVAFWGSFTATQSGSMGPFPPTERTVAVEFSGVFRVEGDRIAEVRLTWDNLSVLGQLGHLASPGRVNR